MSNRKILERGAVSACNLIFWIFGRIGCCWLPYSIDIYFQDFVFVIVFVSVSRRISRRNMVKYTARKSAWSEFNLKTSSRLALRTSLKGSTLNESWNTKVLGYMIYWQFVHLSLFISYKSLFIRNISENEPITCVYPRWTFHWKSSYGSKTLFVCFWFNI